MLALIYGGSGSGKSEAAESLLLELGGGGGAMVYVATMFPYGEETHGRIARHRANRAHKGFTTIERYTDLAGLDVPAGSHVLLECLGNLAANELFSAGGAGEGTEEAVLRGIAVLLRSAANVIVVSNDVFSDGAIYSPETERYCRILAALNRSIARESSLVVETVCGILLRHKEDRGGKE